MVFLFISYIVIIFIFCIPFDIGICAFTDDFAKKLNFSAKVIFFNIFLSKQNKNDKSKNNKKFIKINFNLITFKRLLFHIIPEKILINISFGNDAYPYFLYPLKCIFLSISDYADAIGYGNTVFLNVTSGTEFFLQSEIKVKVNLLIIFSVLFDIIKLNIGRKYGNNRAFK